LRPAERTAVAATAGCDRAGSHSLWPTIRHACGYRSRLCACIAVQALLALAALSSPAAAQSLHLVQDAPLLAERQSDASPLARLASKTKVDLLQLRGGWAKVQADAGQGWLRASVLDLAATGSTMGGPAAARTRALPPRANRHALIVGIGEYRVDPARPVAALPGVPHDMRNALAIARQMQIPADNITLLRDRDATRDGVLQALRELEHRVQPGDRVFVYWSGHGSRYFDPQENGCVETLVPYDLRDLGNREFAQWLQPLARRTDKMMVVYDACHSGGVGGAAAAPSRAWGAGWTPKFTPGVQACQQASNLRTRSLPDAAKALGVSGQDVVYLASSRPDEVSFDNAATGGLATSSLRQCLLGDARDLDGDGTISVGEIAACAQEKIDQALRGQSQLLPHHLVVGGNRAFVPAWFAGSPAPQVTAPALTPHSPPADRPSLSPPPPPSAEPVDVPLSPAGVLEQVHAQRDSKRRVEVQAAAERLRIGVDALDFSVTSSHAGYVYVALLGSDERSLTLLFPNALDAHNRIAAGESLLLPRVGWRITASGPKGRDRLLVLVADGPRDLSALGAAQVGPFAQPLTDAPGRTRLQWLLGTSATGGAVGCQGGGCSDAFGSALLTIEEY